MNQSKSWLSEVALVRYLVPGIPGNLTGGDRRKEESQGGKKAREHDQGLSSKAWGLGGGRQGGFITHQDQRSKDNGKPLVSLCKPATGTQAGSLLQHHRGSLRHPPPPPPTESVVFVAVGWVLVSFVCCVVVVSWKAPTVFGVRGGSQQNFQ